MLKKRSKPKKRKYTFTAQRQTTSEHTGRGRLVVNVGEQDWITFITKMNAALDTLKHYNSYFMDLNELFKLLYKQAHRGEAGVPKTQAEAVRRMIATHVLGAIVSHPGIKTGMDANEKCDIARDALEWADALLAVDLKDRINERMAAYKAAGRDRPADDFGVK